MKTEEARVRKQLKDIGLSDAAINAAWPEWWSEAADPSASARLDLRFSLARKLGLDARSLVDEEGTPRFIWRDEARFKNLSGETDLERAAIASFGRALGSLVISALPENNVSVGGDALALRHSILRFRPFVGLADLLALSWAMGMPVLHPRIYPVGRKRMAAMTVRVGDRTVILLAKDSTYPAPISFYLAHEIGHALLGHLESESSIIDFEKPKPRLDQDDPEEVAADRFALELLTGYPEPRVLPAPGSSYNAPALAHAVQGAAGDLQTEPGTLALCFGYSTGNWAVANSAMSFIYGSGKPVWREVNKLAFREMNLELVPLDSLSYLQSVLGGASLQ